MSSSSETLLLLMASSLLLASPTLIVLDGSHDVGSSFSCASQVLTGIWDLICEKGPLSAITF